MRPEGKIANKAMKKSFVHVIKVETYLALSVISLPDIVVCTSDLARL